MLKCGEKTIQEKIDCVPFHRWIFNDGQIWTLFYRRGESFVLRFPDLADFEVAADGFSVLAHPVVGTSSNTITHLYLNQVLPLALSRQGKLVFHGSAVQTPFGVTAFLGESGRGKSTLAASFASSGCRFLTDDCLLLEKLDRGFSVQPSHPSIRLWDDSREALVHASAPLAPPVQHTPKARILSDDVLAFCDVAQPLRNIYFLGDGCASEVSITPMSPSEALIGLVNHSFLLDIEARDAIAAHFEELTQLVALPLYFRLDYPRHYAALPSVREAILKNASMDIHAS